MYQKGIISTTKTSKQQIDNSFNRIKDIEKITQQKHDQIKHQNQRQNFK